MGRVGVLLLFLGLVGCASVPTPTTLAPVPAEEVKELAGAWQGWLVTERSFALFTLVIKDDGTFEVTGQWTKARGVLLVADGTLRFDGTGAWRAPWRWNAAAASGLSGSSGMTAWCTATCARSSATGSRPCKWLALNV